MQVAIDIRSLVEENLTGIGYYTQSLVAELTRNTSVDWYLYYNQSKSITEPAVVRRLRTLPHVHIIITRYPNKMFNLLVASGLIQLDRVVCNHAGISTLDWFFFPNVGFISTSRKTKTLLAIHDVTFAQFPHYYTFKRRVWHVITRPHKLIRQAHTVVVPSESTGRSIKALCRSYPKIVTIPHGRLEENTTSSLEKKEGKPYFLALATIEPRKNFEGIVQAYKDSRAYTKGIDLVIVGGKGWGYRNILKSFKSTPGITYHGYIPHEEKKKLLSGALALVYPSFYEGFGLPVLEAFSCGVPVITSDRSSLPELCAGAAYLVRPHMVSDIAHALRDLAENPSLREWYAKKGYERAADFSWTKVGEEILSILKEK